MTPEPTGGIYREHGVNAFVRRYGYQDLRNRQDRLNFGGIHRVGCCDKRTNLTLTVDGYDPDSRKIFKAEGSIALLDKQGNVTASWSFASLLSHWSKKHSKVAYV